MRGKNVLANMSSNVLLVNMSKSIYFDHRKHERVKCCHVFHSRNEGRTKCDKIDFNQTINIFLIKKYIFNSLYTLVCHLSTKPLHPNTNPTGTD